MFTDITTGSEHFKDQFFFQKIFKVWDIPCIARVMVRFTFPGGETEMRKFNNSSFGHVIMQGCMEF